MLTVLSVAYPFAPVGPDSVGGAEQVLAALDAGLVGAGHRSIVIATEESRVMGELRALPPVSGPIAAVDYATVRDAQRKLIADVLAQEPVDVVHMHGMEFPDILPPPGVPVLVTLHLPLAWYPAGALRPSRPGTFLHCVSSAQQLGAPSDVELLPPIPNGVDLDVLRPCGTRGEYAVALSRICPEKGLHIALDAARSADVPLVIAGHVYPYPAHERYFAEEIVPRLDERRRFIGKIGMEAKAALLARARCLLVCSTVPETSSLAAMEALACGTPVIAFRHGGLTEFVDHGRTGWLVHSIRELPGAIRRAGDLDATACRATAEVLLSRRLMIRRYLERYYSLASATSRLLRHA